MNWFELAKTLVRDAVNLPKSGNVEDGDVCPDCETPFEIETYPYCKRCKVRWD